MRELERETYSQECAWEEYECENSDRVHRHRLLLRLYSHVFHHLGRIMFALRKVLARADVSVLENSVELFLRVSSVPRLFFPTSEVLT